MTALRWAEGKDPADVWDYSLDASRWLAQVSDTVAGVSVTAEPATITIAATSWTPAGVATVRLSGGTADVDYGITFTLTTTAGRTLQRTVRLLVREL